MSRLMLAVLCFARFASAQEQPSMWRFTTHERIRYRAVTQLGSLLVSTDSALRMLDLSTGDTVWTRSDLRGLTRRTLWLIPETPYALIHTRSREGTTAAWAVIDVRTGLTRWDRTALPFARIFGSVILLDRDLLMVTGVKLGGGPVAAVALSPDSGVVRWTLDSLVDSLAAPNPQDTGACFCIGATQAPLFDSDSTVILAPSPGGLVRLDTRSGRLLWTQDTIRNNTPSELEGYAPLATDSGLLYVPFERGILALRIADGSIAWRGQRKYKGVVHQMAMLPEGLLLGITPRVGTTDTKSYLDLVDPQTGVSRWPSPLGGFSGATAFIVANGAVHFAAGNRWYEIDVAGDSVRREFDYDELAGGEHPYQVEFRDSLYLLISAQGLMAVDTAGNAVFHTYHAAPGASFIQQLATVVLGVVVIAASVAAARSGGPAPVFVPVRAPVVAARVQAMSLASRYLYMYTGDPPDTSERKGFWLTKIDKRDGSTVGWLRFKDRHPEFALDPATDIVLVPVEAEGTAGPGFEAKRLHLKGSSAGTETPTRRVP